MGRQMVWLQIVVAGNVNKNGTHVRAAAAAAAEAGGEGVADAGAQGEFYRKFDLGEWVYCMSHSATALYLLPAFLATLPLFLY